jgi:hypothetical protein
MYFPKSFPATAFYLDYELNVFEIELDSRHNAKRKGGSRIFQAYPTRLFTSRRRALAAAETELRKIARRIESSEKELETKRERVQRQIANA